MLLLHASCTEVDQSLIPLFHIVFFQMSTFEIILTNVWEDHNGNTTKKDKDTHISEKLAAIASKELREEENVRRQCLDHLREWIKQNPDIENCITGKN